MKNNEEAAQTDIPEEATITNPSRPFVRLRGSHSSQQEIQAARPLRRKDDGETQPDGEEDIPPPPPVSTPDLALQFSFCLDDFQPDLNTSIVSAIRQGLDPELSPDPDVRTACVNNSQRIGIWLRPVGNDQDNGARNRGLARLDIIDTGDLVAFFINSALIRREALEEWNAEPKRRKGDGTPDPNGPVHLTGFSVSFESPNKVVTRVEGFDERPWPDVDFVLKTTDTLSLSGGQPRCDSQRDLDVDTSWLDFLTGLSLIALPGTLGIIGAGIFLTQRIIIGSKDAPDVNAGAGCGVPAMIPLETLIPTGKKVVSAYRRLEVFPGAIVAGGFFSVIPRSPEVTITGHSQFAVVEGSTPTLVGSYTLHTEDLRPPFEIAWSGEGAARSPSEETTVFIFSLPGAEAGQVITRRVAVDVVDVDRLSASAELIVRIHVTPRGTPRGTPADVDDDFPLICHIMPWLPQCQEPLARATSSRRREQP